MCDCVVLPFASVLAFRCAVSLPRISVFPLPVVGAFLLPLILIFFVGSFLVPVCSVPPSFGNTFCVVGRVRCLFRAVFACACAKSRFRPPFQRELQ